MRKYVRGGGRGDAAREKRKDEGREEKMKYFVLQKKIWVKSPFTLTLGVIEHAEMKVQSRIESVVSQHE